MMTFLLIDIKFQLIGLLILIRELENIQVQIFIKYFDKRLVDKPFRQTKCNHEICLSEREQFDGYRQASKMDAYWSLRFQLIKIG